MSKRILWKDIKKCFSKSKGRFFSIMCLIALGSFALVGLKVTGPDMRKTAENYFNRLGLADISIIADYGIDAKDKAAIDKASGVRKLEYGYLKDVVIEDTEESIRIFSATDGISKYELVSGRMPKGRGEIALAEFLSDEYSIGDKIPFSEKEDIAGDTVLKNNEMKVVGFVNSGELLSTVNMGQSTSGTGQLNAYAVVAPEAFDSDIYMIVRISFEDTEGVDPYTTQYTELIQAHKDELETLLADSPKYRLNVIRQQYQDKIDDAQSQIDDAKGKLSISLKKLLDGEISLDDAKQQYTDAVIEYGRKRADAKRELNDAALKLSYAAKQISDAESELAEKQSALASAEAALQSARETLDAGWLEYNESLAQLESLKQAKAQLDKAQAEFDTQAAAAEKSAGMTVAQIEEMLPKLKLALPQSQYEQLCLLVEAKNELNSKWAEYNAAAAQAKDADKQLAEAKIRLDSGEKEYSDKKTEIESARTLLSYAELTLIDKKQEYQNGLNTYNTTNAQVNAQLAAARSQLNEASAKIFASERELSDGWLAYSRKKPSADDDIADAEEKTSDAKISRDSLKLPTYSLDTRREIPGAEGYKIYSTVSNIVDSLAGIFPIFLYFVAALVTLTTMTRFVSEERINFGTMKALGYANRDIVKKFTVYGLAASMSGAIVGIITGHTLLPMIVYKAYADDFTYPRIELHFYPLISIVALLLALLCAVVPAYIVANRELQEKPSALLMPKPPEAGSKILLERIRFIWSRMSFTHKVTARNIFRYKKRMLMTIFGVCGSVTLIFAGFSVQHSISGIKDRQFGEIIKYDMIVAQNDGITQKQRDEIDDLLDSDDVASQIQIYYEALTKTAGKNNDKQEIKLIVPQDPSKISEYIVLSERLSGRELELSDRGCIISERLAKLLNVKKGDSFTVNDSEGNRKTVTVADICEMYMGHFMFMNSTYYKTSFGEKYTPNANLITLTDRSDANTKEQSSLFIDLDGVKGVVQNTTLTKQIDTIVDSLNSIMRILIAVAIMLAVVILYNLTNINVCERIRELSTIKVLGFYNKEVTMYIYRETILLTILGILAGFGFGDALYLYIISVVPPEDIMFNPILGAKAFVIPVVVISLITWILGIMMNRKLKNVNMLEALKSVE